MLLSPKPNDCVVLTPVALPNGPVHRYDSDWPVDLLPSSVSVAPFCD